MILQPAPNPTEASNKKIIGVNKLSSEELRRVGESSALDLFHEAAERVPAYKRFLAEHKVNHKKVKTPEDFSKVPAITKENYLRKNEISDLTWDGEIGAASMISRSSGSSGKPFYWLSNEKQRQEVGEMYDLVFSAMFDMRNKKTLIIVAYGMGSWVAGTTTLLSAMDFANKYNCTIMTPGYNRKEVIEICKDIGYQYEQVVICAYPPLVKEIIDLGIQDGIEWPKLKPKFIFGAEAFSEDFRKYILDRSGSSNHLTDTMNTIGSADAMVIGHETPLSIAARKYISSNPLLHDAILGNGRMPTLAQYYPWQKYLEMDNNELHITSNGAIPLIRYNIQDNAKLYSYDELDSSIQQHSSEQLSTILPDDMRDDYDWKLPFVLLYGKSTNAVKFYGAFVYPENIKSSLEKSEYAKYFTGKFKIEKFLDASADQRLRLHIELAPGATAQNITVRDLQKTLVKTICSLNSEYKCVFTDIGKKTVPLVKLVPYGKFELSNTVNKHKYA